MIVEIVEQSILIWAINTYFQNDVCEIS